jgi:hypothetical protein
MRRSLLRPDDGSGDAVPLAFSPEVTFERAEFLEK